jgi:hypothetical protein
VRRFAEAELLPGMRAIAPEAAIELEEFLYYPGLAPTAGDFAILMEGLGVIENSVEAL